MSLQSGLELQEGIARLGITAETLSSLQQALESGQDDAVLARRIEECPVIHCLLLQLASASFYRSATPLISLPMALGLLGERFSRQYLHGLLHSLPRRQTHLGEAELRDELAQAEIRILPVCGRGSQPLLHCVLVLCRLVPLLAGGDHHPNRLPEWRSWGRLLLDRCGARNLPPRISEILSRLDSNAVEETDPELAVNLALLQLVLAVSVGQGTRQCEPGIWRLLDLPVQLMQSLAAGESSRG
ncbi:MAG: hypothetical protein KDC10_00085 [Calditrichaeota bacterium]|nr:hypothetical protein [Candidatus Cloacimonadota bacterium]MCA9787514.1 hypothetical protein [Candidatus Cloacimonadota bacterium]MCB1045571.1 hypothetical protein [Calditrichota bacterium]MCB9473284.1 hypothetical protein [Candidatus Delongbacteria bacterium]